MERVNRICQHPLWRENVAAVETLEQERIFCRHNLVHFLDTARLAYIEVLEKGLSIPKDVLYAAALLHDLGRAWEYTKGISHEEGSVRLAEEILPECGYETEEIAAITGAIRSHREDTAGDSLSGVLYRADKASRMCLFCPALPQCKWSDEKKNMALMG